jgi:hypothetical protein
MPLIRIESRPKTPAPDGPERRRPAQAEEEPKGGLGPAILAGGAVGLLVVAGVSAYVVAQRGAAVPAPAPASSAVVSTAVPGAPTVSVLAALQPLNNDYPRESIIAYVNGEPYTMAQLETAVRVARSLSAISKDPVADYGSPEMRDFQVNMLRLEIDGMLLRQAMRREGLAPPPGDITPAIDGYLQQFGGTGEQLDAALAANGITRAEVADWFTRSRDTQFYIETKLMPGHDPAERKAVIDAWLAEQWKTQDIKPMFYAPSTPVPAEAAPTAAPATP